VFDGHDITRLVAHRRARRGLVRSFQITRLFTRLSVLDNLVLAAGAQRHRQLLSAWRCAADARRMR
jgi:ABC-type branched-subunit amino acid transport system ATPase component